MKNTFIAVFLIFLTLVGFLIYQNYSGKPVSQPSSTTTLPTDTPLNAETVATHNSAQDCWLIINGSVYNATDYLPNHPGGADQIIPYCGKDATDAFNVRGGEGPHPNKAYAELKELLVGPLQ